MVAGVGLAILVSLGRVVIPPAPLFLAQTALGWARRQRRVAGAGAEDGVGRRAARARSRRLHGDLRAGRPAAADRARVWRRNGEVVNRVALSPVQGGRREEFRTFSRRDGVPRGPGGPLDGGRGDRVGPAHRPAALPGWCRDAAEPSSTPTRTCTSRSSADDLPAVLERAAARASPVCVTIGTRRRTTSQAAIALAGREADVWAAVGIHPHDAAASDAETVQEIERLAAQAPRVVAIGEIGLDFFRNLSPPDVQARTFRALARASPRRLRQARADPLPRRARRDARRSWPRRVVGRPAASCTASRATWPSRGVVSIWDSTISLAGPVTYPNARALPEVARFVPADRLVVETDCPFLPPQGHRAAAQRARLPGAHGRPRGPSCAASRWRAWAGSCATTPAACSGWSERGRRAGATPDSFFARGWARRSRAGAIVAAPALALAGARSTRCCAAPAHRWR